MFPPRPHARFSWQDRIKDATPSPQEGEARSNSVLFVERDRSARCIFEVARRNEYFDLLPHLREYRRQGVVPATLARAAVPLPGARR